MRYAWLLWLPLLFLPNLGHANATTFGTVELSDYLVGPYILLVILAPPTRKLCPLSQHTAVLLAFLLWACVSTLSINLRYAYSSDYAIVFGLLKLAKLALYGTAGVLTARALRDLRSRQYFYWSLIATACVVALTLLMMPAAAEAYSPRNAVPEGYKATNAISAALAILICYLFGIWITKGGTRRWRRIAGPALLLVTLGFFLSDGRGGWVAAGLGIAYLFYRLGIGRRVLVAILFACCLVAVGYEKMPEFRDQVDRTLFPDQQFLQEYGAGIAGIDDGGRVGIWQREAAKLVDDPILGAGFFHRGGQSALWSSGSHNFWLQMFLETGLVGGSLVLVAFVRMWRCAGSRSARDARLELPVKAALVAAFASGMSGEYFYGGTVLLILLLVYAPVRACHLAAPARGGGLHKAILSGHIKRGAESAARGNRHLVS